MEMIMRLILEVMCCLVALCASGFFAVMIYMEVKNNQRDEERDRRREEREEAYHRRQMETFRS